MSTCTRCPRQTDGTHKLCDACREDRKKYWKDNRIRLSSLRKQEYQDLSTERRIWRAAKCRALRDGIPFDIKVSDIYVPSVCPVFGIKLERSKGKATDASPSLDKIIPELGYIAGNIWVISNRANRLKHDATVEELDRLVTALKAQAWMLQTM